MTCRRISRFASLVLAVGGLAACTSLFGAGDVKVRPIENMPNLAGPQPDRLYESAVSAINSRDYALALDYLQEAKARDPRNVKTLNALGVVYDKLGRFDLSARYYAQAREIEPQSRIVAENFSYSRILQGLLSPVQPAAIARVDLPPELNRVPPKPAMVVAGAPRSVATDVSVAEKTAVTAPAPVAVPAVPEPHRVAAVPVMFGMPSLQKLAVATPAIAPVLPPSAPVLEKHEANATASPIRSTAGATAGDMAPAVLPSALKSIAAESARLAGATLRRNIGPANPRIVTIGQPIKIVNATGSRSRAEVVTHRLAALGWTLRLSDAGRAQVQSTLFYPTANVIAAKAMQRTLPFPVHLAPGSSAMRLVIGRDYLAWKPRNARLAKLWQKGPIVASVQKPQIRGVR